ncbi:proteasome subunit alpha [Nocardioides mangrovicus]|uniref:Proteasome subunit alpha n=1 Tax=Nocardioides mangrovicus TaxID=2478913 RepID=A0A3L8P1B5_9ACTN|nr:proteasome subunit alpha [Nocardioides mangrovicus]RLV48702.1 proteasome subunit alpha [Nocardioides mangrovicus]
MSMPFYVSPEQLMKDRADFARKGIGRGRALAVVQYADGVLFVSENPSQALHKISELYDRIAFAAVGRYNEFENLRIAGVRLADMRGYAYDRRDVTGRGLANAYAQTLGTIFSSGGEKPYEVEIFVAEIGDTSAGDQIFRLTYDGQVADEHGFAAMGGATEPVTTYLREHWSEGLSLAEAVTLAVGALGHGGSSEGEAKVRRIPVADLEVAVLDRDRPQQRKFRRLGDAALGEILGPDPDPDPTPAAAPASDPGSPAAETAAAPQAPASPAVASPTTTAPTPPPSDPLGGPIGEDRPPVAPPVDPDDPLA